MYIGRNPMAKKSSASSRPARPTRRSAESIWSKPLTKAQRTALDTIAKRQELGDTTEIDYSDIPKFTDRQLAGFERPRKKLVAVRLDEDVYDWLRKHGSGYSTRINSVLRAVMVRSR
jgi:uncharacterized protein (DUF4415 family)